MAWLSRIAGAAPATTGRTQPFDEDGPVLVVWDFDWSLINENSDTFVLGKLAPKLLEDLKYLQVTEPERFGRGCWTALMDRLLTLLATREGVDRPALEACLDGTPMFEETAAAVRLAAAAGCEQRILSDANEVFIERILKARGVAPATFSAICTNPARYEAVERRRESEAPREALRVFPFHPADEAAHGCAKCPRNLCKGLVLDRWIGEVRPRRIVYVGDGSGDFCPAARLEAGDLVCMRAGYPLAKKVRKLARDQLDPFTLDAATVEWRDGADLLRVFKRELKPAARRKT